MILLFSRQYQLSTFHTPGSVLDPKFMPKNLPHGKRDITLGGMRFLPDFCLPVLILSAEELRDP